MNSNIPIAAAFTLLVFLFIFSCTNADTSKIDERDLRDYPAGKIHDQKAGDTMSPEESHQ